MQTRCARRSERARLCFSAGRGTNSGRRVKRAGICCGSAKFAWTATPTHCSCACKPLGLAFATKVTGAAFFALLRQVDKQRLLRNERLSPRKFTDRRKRDEPAETRNPKRKPARSDARTFCARRLENHAELAKLRPHDRRSRNRMLDGARPRDGALRRIRSAGRGNHGSRLGGGNRRRGRGIIRAYLRKTKASASSLGSGGAGRFADSQAQRFGRQSDCDGGRAHHGKLPGKTWCAIAR